MRHFMRRWTWYVSLGVVGCVLVAYALIPDFRDFLDAFWMVIWSGDENKIVEYFTEFGIWGAVLIIILMVVQMFLIIFPTWLPMIVAVLGYGPVKGFFISVTAVFTASTVGYYIGERFSMTAKKGVLSTKTYRKLSGLMREYGFWMVVLFRISPFLSNDAISFVAGIMKMGYRKYIGATMLGIIPLAAAIAIVGKNTETLETGLYWIGGVGVILYALYVYLKRRKNKNA